MFTTKDIQCSEQMSHKSIVREVRSNGYPLSKIIMHEKQLQNLKINLVAPNKTKKTNCKKNKIYVNKKEQKQ